MVRNTHVPDRVSVLAVHVLLPGARNGARFAIARDVYFARRVLVPKVTRGKFWNGVIAVRHMSELVAELRIDEVCECQVACARETKNDCID